jgi:hypothetical protein
MLFKIISRLAAIVLLSTGITHATSYNPIALSGSTGINLGLGPGLGADVHFDLFDNPILNSNGEIAFISTLAGSDTSASNNLGLWNSANGSLNAVARTGSVGPGPGIEGGVSFAVLDDPVLNNEGKVSFVGVLTGTGISTDNQLGIWSNVDGTLAPIARSGGNGPGPGLGTGVNFSGFSLLLFNDSGQIAFRGSLTGTGIDASNRDGIWIKNEGSPGVVVRTGTSGPGPGLGSGVNFGSIVSVRMNAGGDIVFDGTLTGTGITSANNQGLWTWNDNALQLIARSGSAEPGPNLGAGVYFSSFGTSRINAAGDVAFLGDLTGTGINSSNNRGVWRVTNNATELIARRGMDGPGPGVGAGISFSTMNGTLTGSNVNSSNNSGLWLHKDGILEVVARTGSTGPGPDLGAGVSFSGFPSHAVNASGVIAFAGTLTGTGINSSNDAGIWASVEGSMINIVRTGDQLDVNPTAGVDLRTVSEVEIGTGAGGEDGFGYSLNDDGLLVLRLAFTDGSNGIFTTQIGDLAPAGDFDLDGDVDGRDFLVWQRNPAVGDLGDWQTNYGVGALFSNSMVVPEPASVLLGWLGIFALACRRHGQFLLGGRFANH